MPILAKPDVNTIWADRGATTAPSNAKIATGWVVEIPPYQMFNWWMKRADAFMAHNNQRGIPAWDAATQYYAGVSYVAGVGNGLVYRAVTTHTGINPETDVNGNWQIAFERGGTALLKAQNLADVPNKALARQNLGISTTADYDGRYLQRSQNLADIPNKSTGRANLDVYSKQEVIDLINNMQPAGEVAAFARNTAPDGWLVCNGQAVSRTTYARLFAAIGTTFGAGNGSSTFNIPDLRGEFIRGWDSGRGVDTGRSFGSQQSSQNLSHSHPVNDPGHIHTENYRRNGDTTTVRYNDVLKTGQSGNHVQPTSTATTGITLGSSGGNESRPRNVALLYCIRT